jgi:hypothetical protein
MKKLIILAMLLLTIPAIKAMEEVPPAPPEVNEVGPDNGLLRQEQFEAGIQAMRAAIAQLQEQNAAHAQVRAAHEQFLNDFQQRQAQQLEQRANQDRIYTARINLILEQRNKKATMLQKTVGIGAMVIIGGAALYELLPKLYRKLRDKINAKLVKVVRKPTVAKKSISKRKKV